MTDWTATDVDLRRRSEERRRIHVRLGSEEHKALFCRALLQTFNPYKPAVIDWPPLEEEVLQRLTSLPIWDIAVQTEEKASRRVKAYAEIVSDPLLREAIELNAFEEARHRHVLANLVSAYGIKLAPETAYRTPRDTEWAFMVTGFSECVDSFFAFGLFELARRTGYFPAALVDTFEPVIHEEGRHILFFVNWVEWRRRRLSILQRLWFDLRVAAVWVFLAWERLAVVQQMDGEGATPQDNNFTVTGTKAVGVDVTLRGLIDVCLAENDRRLGAYDHRLVRPKFIPNLVRMIRRFLPQTAAPAA
ncbi:MAG TPA: ferritin family protein [Caulobacteraceae bacterium]|jgi:hypothetical protein